MITLKFDVTPEPKGRPRFTKTGRTYTDAKTLAFERTIQTLARLQFKRTPFDCPLAIGVCFYFERPKSVRREQHTVKPDIDNLLKSVLDSLNKICWNDDAQIVSVNSFKFYAAKSGIILEIREATT